MYNLHISCSLEREHVEPKVYVSVCVCVLTYVLVIEHQEKSLTGL